MAIDPPYRLDPFQNIINIKWGPEEATTGGHLTLWFYPMWATDNLWYLFYIQYFYNPPPVETQTHATAATLEITEDQSEYLEVPANNLKDIFPSETREIYDQWIEDYFYYLTHPGTPYPTAPLIACPVTATA